MNKRILQSLLIAGYLFVVAWPIIIFWRNRMGVDLLAQPLSGSMRLLFPLFGLLAFSLVAMQAIIGSNLQNLKLVFPRITEFHKIEGLFALVLMLLHPLMIVLGFGVVDYWQRNFVPPDLRNYIWFGYAGLVILVASIVTAYLAWRGLGPPWWRKLHRFNYLAFLLIWVHSWFIGSDVRTSSLRYLWLFYLVVVTLSGWQRYQKHFRVQS